MVDIVDPGEELDFKPNSPELVAIHEKALRDFNRIQTALRDERKQSLQDRRFYTIAGAMWEGPLNQQYENKPKLEVNKIKLAVTRINNEYRANRISVEFIPKDGDDTANLTDATAGLYRADDLDGGAEEAQDIAFEEGIGGGLGAWRLRTRYVNEDDDSDEQRIVFEPITDADKSVFFDLDAKKQDKSDAKYCFVITAYSRQDYVDEYKDDPTNWPAAINETFNDWLTPDVVFIAEYYLIEEVATPFVWYTSLTGTETRYDADELKEDAETRKMLKATGAKKTKSKTLKIRNVHKYIMSGGSILKDEGYIAGKNIPVIVFYGNRWFIDNVERCAGHVRYAKDPQRLKNMQLSKLAEISALGAVSKPIFTPEQMLGHTLMWERDNIENKPFLLVNALMDATGAPTLIGPQTYTKSPEVPPAMAALLQLTEQDIQDILGNQEAGEQIQPNVSGVALELLQEKLDMQTYIYISNMEKAVKRCGEIWLSMAKEIYVEENRKMKTVDKSGKIGSIKLKSPGIDPKTDAPTTKNDLTNANFDCTAKAGPNTASKRAAIAKVMIGLLQFVQDPQTVSVIVSTIMMNLEGEGLDDLRAYYRQRLLQMGVVKPTPEEQKELQQQQANQPPDPQATYLQAAATEAQSAAAKNVGDLELTAAKVELTKAQAAQALKGISSQDIQNSLAVIDSLTAAHERVANAASANADAAQTAATPPPQPGAG